MVLETEINQKDIKQKYALNKKINEQNKASLDKPQKCKTETDIEEILETISLYLKDFKGRTYLPLPLFNAIDRYNDWIRKNPKAKLTAKEQTISELYDLYGLSKYSEIVLPNFFADCLLPNQIVLPPNLLYDTCDIYPPFTWT